MKKPCSEEAEAFYIEGLEYIHYGDLKNAARSLKRAIERNHPEAVDLLKDIYSKMLKQN